ncbi:hypothetical protein [Micromonospora sp. HK10]|uniref:hypothetical protein n=1 Tax=Micromonospora sp. HK10 TaxID=1538294 RepID=UPI0006968A6B|nr:hypothetical protein [Micromonospora sp. HK10]
MRDEEVFQAIADRVAALDYSDWVYVRPGHLDADGGWVRTPAAGDVRWLEERGSPTHRAAEAAGAVDPLPPLEPASVDAVAEAERLLGHPLPPLLRRLYLEVANGGFGPGILGVAGGHPDDRGRTAVDRLDAREPAGLFPVAYWGCGIYSYVDCSEPSAMMWGFDPNSGRAERSFFPEGISLTEWLSRWLDGRLHQPMVVQDPQTGAWRGATAAEHEAEALAVAELAARINGRLADGREAQG